MNRTRLSFAVLSLASASLCTLAGCSSPNAQPPAAPAERVAQVRTVTLAPRTVVDRTSLPAALEPRHRASLAAEVGGAVESVRAELGEEIEKVNKQFARVEQIKQFRLIEQRLTAEDEELTPTMKLKRALVSRKYGELIESMYEGKAAA